jgi:hypothetical protein
MSGQGAIYSNVQTIGMLQNAFYNGTNYIYKASAEASFYYQSGGAHNWFRAASGTAGNAITFTQAMTLDASGNLLVGTTTLASSERLNVTKSTTDWVQRIYNSNASPKGLAVIYDSAAPNGTSNTFLYCQDSNAIRAEIRSNGGLANYSANNVNLASDERLKKDISLLDSTWQKVKDIEVVNFRYKDCNEGDPLLYGVIAQQVQPIVPELVVVTQEAKEATEDTETTPEYYGIREQPMYWLAVKALQEAMDRIEKLEAEVALLKGAA